MSQRIPFPIEPDSGELWRKFIDPVHWREAELKFPGEPWKYYLKPTGQNEPQKWEFFNAAVRYIWNKAATNRNSSIETFTLQELLETNALVMLGDRAQWRNILRDNRPIFNCRTTDEIHRVYTNGSCVYHNEDGLKLQVDGFWPEGELSLDFFSSCRVLSGILIKESPTQWETAYASFRSMLLPKVSMTQGRWQVYFLTRRQQLETQLETVLAWYVNEANKLLAVPKSSVDRQRVLELAVKMQRYIDIAQFCMDGSGRTSKLIQDYIFLRFGYPPPNPVLYEAYGHAWENGTYLTLKEAVQFVGLGWKRT